MQQDINVAHLCELAGAAVRSIVKLVEALRQYENELDFKRFGEPLASSPKRARRSEQDEERPFGSPFGSHQVLDPEAPADLPIEPVQPLDRSDKDVASEAAQALLDLGAQPNEPVEQPSDVPDALDEARQLDEHNEAGQPDEQPSALELDEQPIDVLEPNEQPSEAGQPDTLEPDEQPIDVLEPNEQPSEAGQPDALEPDEQPIDALEHNEQPSEAGQPDAMEPDEQPIDAFCLEHNERPSEAGQPEALDEQHNEAPEPVALSETSDEPLDASEAEPAVDARPAEGPPLAPGEFVALREAQHPEHNEAPHNGPQRYTVACIDSYDAERDEANIAMYELVDAGGRVHELIGMARVQGFRAAVIPSWLVVQQLDDTRIKVLKAGELDPVVQGRFVAVRGNDTPDQCRDQIWLYETTSSKPYLRRGQLLQRCSEHFYDGPGSYELIPVHSAICPYSVLDWDVPLKVHSDGTYCLRTKTYEGLRYQLKTSLRTHK
jgi:hypothetical protein